MKISLLQPAIERGNITQNTAVIQNLINTADGDLLLLAEYALTGSLVLDENADIQKWAVESDAAIKRLSVPAGKNLLINSLINKDGKIFNACTLLPENKVVQLKTIPDKTELDAGINAGSGNNIIQLNGKKIVILICSDMLGIENTSTAGVDVIFFIYHFTPDNYQKHIGNLVTLSKERNLPILAVSLTSDKNYGHSSYVAGSTIVALGNHEGILEITL